ncbi:MAG: Uma2 family endonuclease [Peptococcaceae bacterium]|jgi:Uma2 family endonuclease|nr:Uma2 family endonuclease [Peptococcaceae bacterium]
MDGTGETALPYRNGKYTYDDYAKLPEGSRYQLIRGELVVAPAPTPFHQEVSSNLNDRLHRFVRENAPGSVLYPPWTSI